MTIHQSIGRFIRPKVLAGKLKPNLGRFDNPPDWQECLPGVGRSGGRGYDRYGFKMF